MKVSGRVKLRWALQEKSLERDPTFLQPSSIQPTLFQLSNNKKSSSNQTQPTNLLKLSNVQHEDHHYYGADEEDKRHDEGDWCPLDDIQHHLVEIDEKPIEHRRPFAN